MTIRSLTRELSHLLKLAAPVAASHLANMGMQLVDTLFVGRLGPEALGGVGVGNSVFSTLMVVGIGLLTGMDYLTAHAFGAGRFKECHRLLVQAVYLATFVALPFTVALFFSSGIFHLLGVNPSVASQGAIYLKVLCLSLWPVLLFMAFRQYLQAMGIAMAVLLIMILANAVNALGNWAFIFGHLGFPPMGVGGSALSTVVARTAALIAIVVYTWMRERRLELGLRSVPLQLSLKHLKRLVQLGLPAGIQMLLEVGVFALATLLVGKLTAEALAAHHIVLHVASNMFMIPLGLSAAAAVRVGQALGSNQWGRAQRIGWIAIAAGSAFMMVSSATLYGAAVPILHAFTSDASVVEIGKGLLLVAALFQISDGIQVTTTGVLRGIGNTHASMIANLVGHWFIGLPIGYFLCFSLHWGAKGLWVGLSVGLTVVAALLLAVWRAKSNELRI